jgi:hypothetical protein
MVGTHSSATPVGIDICIATKGGDNVIDLDGPEIRLLLAGSIGCLLVGALAVILIQHKTRRR